MEGETRPIRSSPLSLPLPFAPIKLRPAHTGFSKSIIILDRIRRLVAVLAGRPKGEEWMRKMDALLEELLRLGFEVHFAPHQKEHRRGNFPVLNLGFSHGGGPKRPFMFNNDRHVTEIHHLLGLKELRDLAGFQDGVHATWWPLSYERYRSMMRTVLKDRGFIRNFKNSNFPSCTVNFGPKAQTRRHRDLMNYAGGVCLITCMGTHDATKGGHLILWELGVFVQFPHGTTVAIPSSIITHSNLPVAEHEKRVSVTQFAAGALFRYVDNGCRNDNELSPEELAKAKVDRKERFQKILNFFTGRARKAEDDLADLSELSELSDEE
jgi:hypothetical protein